LSQVIPSVAVIEDEVNIASMYEFKLKQHGFRVKCAHNGVEGLELVKEMKPDLILLDLKMPEMNGDEMLEKLRATKLGSDLKVIILTNISKDEAPHSLRLLHVDRYIVKAYHTPSQVMSIVYEVLGLRKDLVE
jgi:DNA-binding response OmpR family regulator